MIRFSRTIILALWAMALWPASGIAHQGQHPHTPPWQAATVWPDRVVTTFSDDPATTLTITWRTDASVGFTVAQITKATPDARFDLSATTRRASTEIIDLEELETDRGVHFSQYNIGLGKVAYHSIKFEDLEPDTLYAWRVQGAEGAWSEWYQTRTAARDGPAEFVYFGDAQLGIRSHWSRVIRMAQTVVPEADFFLHAGDLVDRAERDKEWGAWFEAGGFIHAQIPQMPVPGNHDTMRMHTEDPKAAWRRSTQRGPERVAVISPLWRAQFELPLEPELPTSLQEAAYDVRYSEDLHVFVVASDGRAEGGSFDAQTAWLDQGLAASDAKWKVVSMHHPFFVAEEFITRSGDRQRREAFLPIIEKHSVDLVLVGHYHGYVRAADQPNPQRYVAREATGASGLVDTVFAISVSGGWAGEEGGSFLEGGLADLTGDGVIDYDSVSLDRLAGNTPLFQVIRIDDDRLSYEARMATGDVYDAFVLQKNADQTKTMIEGPAAFGETRLFSNTGPTQHHHELSN